MLGIKKIKYIFLIYILISLVNTTESVQEPDHEDALDVASIWDEKEKEFEKLENEMKRSNEEKAQNSEEKASQEAGSEETDEQEEARLEKEEQDLREKLWTDYLSDDSDSVNIDLARNVVYKFFLKMDVEALNTLKTGFEEGKRDEENDTSQAASVILDEFLNNAYNDKEFQTNSLALNLLTFDAYNEFAEKDSERLNTLASKYYDMSNVKEAEEEEEEETEESEMPNVPDMDMRKINEMLGTNLDSNIDPSMITSEYTENVKNELDAVFNSEPGTVPAGYTEMEWFEKQKKDLANMLGDQDFGMEELSFDDYKAAMTAAKKSNKNKKEKLDQKEVDSVEKVDVKEDL